MSICGYADIAGNSGYCMAGSTFVTGASANTSNVTVATIVPSNAQTGVPLNAQIVAVMSNAIDPASIHEQRNRGHAFERQFDSRNRHSRQRRRYPHIRSQYDADGLEGVYDFGGRFRRHRGQFRRALYQHVHLGHQFLWSQFVQAVFDNSGEQNHRRIGDSPVTFTMTSLIDAASVNTQTVEVEVCFDGTSCSESEYVAGSFSINGATVTFTPLTQYPANTVIGMYLQGLMDEAGNAVYSPKFGTFTTASTVDQTPPTVSITPTNGATNAGLNTQIVLTFSKSMNPSTITSTSLAVFSGSTPVDVVDGMSISEDSRTITLNPGGNAWTPGAVITIELTSAIQDLSGNPLANTTSHFSLTAATGNSAPTVVAMRPGNGATNVPANTAVTLFTSAAMNPSTITGALYVTDNGVPVLGTVQLFSNAQAIEFTPANSFNPGDLIQVFLSSTAQGANGVALGSFSGQFTVTGSPANTAAGAQAVNPFPNATNVPLNVPIQVEFNQPLQASTVSCNGSSGSVTSTSPARPPI